MVFFPGAKACGAGGILDNAYHTQLCQNEKTAAQEASKRYQHGFPGVAGSPPLKSTIKQGS